MLTFGFLFYSSSLFVCVLPFFQEEDIPELEIDMDELLDLSDAEQRAKLHVSSKSLVYSDLCTNTIHLPANTVAVLN